MSKKRKLENVTSFNKRNKNKRILKTSELPFRLLCLFNYYKRILKENPELAEMAYNIDVHRDPISNRGLEHLITNYSRKYNLILDEKGKETDDAEFIVADEYFKHLPKTDTDPCCRGALIQYPVGDKILETTIPQLGSNISLCKSPTLKYAKKYCKEIRKDLNILKGLPQPTSSSEIYLPRKKERSLHTLIAKKIIVDV